MVKRTLIAIPVLLAACGAPDQAPQARSNTTDTTLVPGDTVVEPVQPITPPAPWVLPDTTRWSGYWWTSYRDSTGTLAVRGADLDGDGVLDKARVVEQHTGSGAGGPKGVWIDRATGSDTVLVIEGGEAELDTIGFGLLIWPAGDIDHLGSDTEDIPSPFHSAHPVLSVIYFEKSAVTYVWMNGRFIPVWTGD